VSVEFRGAHRRRRIPPGKHNDERHAAIPHGVDDLAIPTADSVPGKRQFAEAISFSHVHTG
jgi:hypothetical protein